MAIKQLASSIGFPKHPARSKEKVRQMDAGALNIKNEITDSNMLSAPEVGEHDSILTEVIALLNQQYAGVIFTGPPGTSKSWYARQIGTLLAERNPHRIRFVQFHPSYQYEDFVEGYIPSAGAFAMKPKHLIQMCEAAADEPDKLFIIVIDELSRTDPSRVFGEALTYIEMSKRGLAFHLSSGRELSIPKNLVFLCTMNPWDSNVEEVDIALERRFAKIPLEPDSNILETLLSNNGVDDALRQGLLDFFKFISTHRNERCRIGHAYFLQVKNVIDAQRLWRNQLKFHFERVLQLEPDDLAALEKRWKDVTGENTTNNVATANIQEAVGNA